MILIFGIYDMLCFFIYMADLLLKFCTVSEALLISYHYYSMTIKAFIHSFIHSFIHLFIHSFIHKFGSNNHVPLRTNCKTFTDPLTFYLRLSLGEFFNFFSTLFYGLIPAKQGMIAEESLYYHIRHNSKYIFKCEQLKSKRTVQSIYSWLTSLTGCLKPLSGMSGINICTTPMQNTLLLNELFLTRVWPLSCRFM